VHGVESILPFLDDPNVIAVGEAGLDHYYDHSPRDVQRTAFTAQIQLAHERGLPLVIHTRDAWADTFDVLDAEGMPERTIFHCFTGGPDEARACLDRGAFLSFSGIVTFKTATDLQAAARLCPADRLLVETDSPYLAPVPHRGRTNQPAFVGHVARFVADLRDEPLAAFAAATVAATRTAFPALG
jgi:TatD DNase family protein